MSIAVSFRPLAITTALAGTLLLAAPVTAQSMPGGVTDANGRVYGTAVPAQQLPSVPPMVSHPVVQPLPQGVPRGMPQAMPHAMPAAPTMHPGSYPAHGPAHAMGHAPGFDQAGWERAKGDWLIECRRRMSGSKGKTTGAVIGGLFGGLVGNRIAGRGDRTIGTIAGAAVGAVAGGAIGASADRSRARDYCEAYLEDSLAGYYGGQGQAGYGYGYQPAGHGYAMQPHMMMVMHHAAPAAAPARECVETTVIEEWVPVKTHKRYIAPRPDKRVKIVPDKRVRMN